MDKIVCVGKNYVEHVKELGGSHGEKPVLFLKPPSVLRAAQNIGETLELRLPPDVGLVHHECEIVLRLESGGYRMSLSEAERAIGAVTLGLDMTLRDRQNELKRAGHPWTTSKVFLDSAVIGPWRRVREFSHFLDQKFSFAIDGIVRQEGMGIQMTMGPAACIAYISECFPLCPGDLIFTGTPAGVGPVTAGQTATLGWGDLSYSVRWKTFEK